MKRLILLAFTGIVALCGCQSSGETINSPRPIISPTSITPITSTPNDPLNLWIGKYPELTSFNSIQDWKSITIISGQDTVTITDPEILQAAGNLFIIKQEKRDLTNGPDYNMDTFSLKLTNSEGTFLVDVVSRGVVAFPELAPGVYFDVLSSDITSFGKAWMKKPNHVPIESTESRMLNSGMIYVVEDKYHFYMISESRVRLVSIAFLDAEKKKIKNPVAIPSDIVEEITFYLYGNKIQMKVYPNNIEIMDGNQKTWYEVDKSTTGQIHSKISGN